MDKKIILAILVVFIFVSGCTSNLPIGSNNLPADNSVPNEDIKPDTGKDTARTDTIVEVPIEDKPELTEQFSVTLKAEKTGGKVKLIWTPYPGKFTSYKIMRSTTDPNPKYPGAELIKTIPSANETSYIDSRPEAAVNYYSVGVVADLNKGDMSNVVSVEFADSREKQGNTITLEAVKTPDGVNLTWNAYDESGSKLMYYKVVRSDTNPNPKYPIDTGISAIPYVEKTSYLDRGTDLGKTYYYAITVVRKDMTRYSSGPVIVKT